MARQIESHDIQSPQIFLPGIPLIVWVSHVLLPVLEGRLRKFAGRSIRAIPRTSARQVRVWSQNSSTLFAIHCVSFREWSASEHDFVYYPGKACMATKQDHICAGLLSKRQILTWNAPQVPWHHQTEHLEAEDGQVRLSSSVFSEPPATPRLLPLELLPLTISPVQTWDWETPELVNH